MNLIFAATRAQANKLFKNFDEVFLELEDFAGYWVSNKGRLFSLRRNTTLKLTTSHGGRLKATLQKDGVTKQAWLHRLIAQTFLPNPSGYKYVIHKDRNYTNNNTSNLLWGNNPTEHYA